MVESFWSEPSWHKRQQYNARWLLVQQGRTDGFLSSGSKSARGQRRHFFSFFRSQFTIALSGLCISHLLLLLRIPPVDDSSSLRCAPGTSSCLFLRIDYVLHWMITMEWNYQLTRPNWWGGGNIWIRLKTCVDSHLKGLWVSTRWWWRDGQRRDGRERVDPLFVDKAGGQEDESEEKGSCFRCWE